MNSIQRVLLANKSWAKEKTERRPEYFTQLAKDQKPEFLWIGCSDSRVPAEEITGLQPGEIFVHRNVANLVVHADFNLQSVLQYAVEVLRIPHIIVCGHYGCGGVRAAMSKQYLGTLDRWLYNIKGTWDQHFTDLKSLSEEQQHERLVELNVLDQVRSLSRMALIQKSWKETRAPQIHGWVFGLNDGLIRNLVTMDANSPIEEVYRFNF